MKKYDPNLAPDPEDWNTLDESECMLLVEEYHKRKQIKLPNAEVHAVLHTIVENQILMGDEINTAKTLERLMTEGLDRHESLHAIGYIVIEHMHKVMASKTPFNEEEFNAELDDLSVEKWMKIFAE